MSLLAKDAFLNALHWIDTNGRPLEKALKDYYFANGDVSEVLVELKNFQNEDGGFGHGLEPDFRLPKSSPLATTVAFQHLIPFKKHALAQEMIQHGIAYFENCFQQDRNGWIAVPPEVNDYPHAIWWHVNEDGKSVIDLHWGNPSAEIIGYLYHFYAYVKKLDVEELVSFSLNHLTSLTEFQSEHEMYCYLRFFDLNPSLLTERYQQKLKEAITALVHLSEQDWKNYVPSPLSFINSPSKNYYGVSEEAIQANLIYVVQQITENGFISPNWAWPQYQDIWQQAKQEWSGVLTLKKLLQLDAFSYIDK